MKIKSILTIALGLVVLSSCQKQEDDLPSLPKERLNHSAIAQVATLKSLQEIKVAYRLLNNRERSALWKKHLDEYIHVGLTKKQESMILEARNKLTPEAFDDNDTDLRNFMQEWLVEAKDIFSRELISEMLESPMSAKVRRELDGKDSGSKTDCNC